jgi:hypothetical protein
MNGCSIRCRREGLARVLAVGLPVAALTMLVALTGCSRDGPQELTWDFSRTDALGAPLAGDADVQHHCVLDGRTGLLWEVKQAAAGLHRHDATYTWHSTDATEHGGEAGIAAGGACDLPRCDTEAFVAAVNVAGLCGRHDWRMPSRDEALSVMDITRIGKGPVLDPRYFPGALEAEYWTATTFRLYPQGAWATDNVYAQDRVDWKYTAKHVRLVNGPKDAVKPKRRGK